MAKDLDFRQLCLYCAVYPNTLVPTPAICITETKYIAGNDHHNFVKSCFMFVLSYKTCK